MHNSIKPRLSPGEIAELVHLGLGEAVEIVATSEFDDGYFNAVHAVSLADGRELVLKAAPPPGTKLLRYEVELMRTEIHFFERARAAGVPLPRVHHADPDRGVIIMDRLRGVTLQSVRDRLPSSALSELRRELGGLSSIISGIHTDAFGYPRRDGHTQNRSWRASFTQIFADLLTDADEFQAPLPRSTGDIAALFERHAPLLDEVRTPSLVHFDLWDGNVFVVETGQGWRVEGLIDGERALYGDPIMELAPMTSFIPADQAEVVVHAALGRGLTAPEQVRLTLYTVYLYLGLVTEGFSRGYDPVEFAPQHERFTRELAEHLSTLEQAGTRLAGGRTTEVVRLADGVHRPARPWTPAVHALLGHLGSVGVVGIPEVKGFDAQGREVLGFLEGDTLGETRPWPGWVFSDRALTQAAAWLRRLHDATADFVPPADAVWFAGQKWQPGLVIGHHDATPYNAVWRGGELLGFVDWDTAGPSSRELDLAFSALFWVPLHAERLLPELGYADLGDRQRRLHLFLDAYGYEGDRSAFRATVALRARINSDVIRRLAADGDPVYTALLPLADDYAQAALEVEQLPGGFFSAP